MTAKRRYRLLCPIARALDAVGDRWALLILRDLHAGPARYQELNEGLGIATNLLSTRLAELTDAGLLSAYWGVDPQQWPYLAYLIALSWVLVSLSCMYRAMLALIRKRKH